MTSLLKHIFKKWLILPFFAVLTFLLTVWLTKHPGFTEKMYAQKLYPAIANLLSRLSSLFSFSLDDIFYLLLIGTGLVLLLFLICRKISWKRLGKTMLNILSVCYILFYWLWGFNYFREDVYARLQLTENTTDSTVFIRTLHYFIQQTNESYCKWELLDAGKTDSLIEDSYSRLSGYLKIQYPLGKRKPKNITFSRFFAAAGISGYMGPYFNEIHVNRHVPTVQYPMTLAHEKAHQLGITSEAEASFYAWLICVQSPSDVLQYSANLSVLRHFLYHASSLENADDLEEKISPEVQKDIQKIREHWLALRNKKIDKAASKINDLYLKTNKVEAGIHDYHGVVRHVMDFMTDSIFLNK